MMIGLIIIGGLVLVALVVVFLYNGLIQTKNRVEESWSGITVQLKRRADLIPNLVNTVKGYAKHEAGVFEKVTEARSAVTGASGVADTAKADNMLTQSLKSLFAVAENYPDLKANTNYQDLQTQLADTEDKIQASRRFYNSAVRDLNNKVETVPTNVVAKLFKIGKREFYDVEESEAASIQKPTDVQF